MTDPQPERPTVRFTLDPGGPSKRPEQLITLLESSLEREFPNAVGVVEVSHSVVDGVITILNLEKVDAATAKKLAARARGVYNDFMISPWY